jgi:large subunit ribosomal protein L18
MITQKTRKQLRKKRHMRIRAKVKGTSSIPRVAVHKSNTSLYLQLIDDSKSITLASAKGSGKNIQTARELGSRFAQIIKKKGVLRVVFDREGYRYHGTVKAIADAIREGGVMI